MGRHLIARVALVASIALSAGCGAESATPSEEEGAAASSQAPSAAGDAPAPVAMWEFDGDGHATVSSLLTFAGIHEFGDDAVVLDGHTGYGATSDAGPLDTTSSFSTAAWVTLSHAADYATVLSQTGDVAAAFYLGTGEGVWNFAMKDMDTNEPGHTIRALGTTPTVDPDTWVHVAGVFDSAVGELRLFIDGELAAATAFDAPWQAGGPIIVGGSQAHGAPSDFWPGAISHAAVYQTALTAQQIARLRESTRPTTVPPLLAIDPATYAHGVLDGTWDLQMSDEQVKSLASSFSPGEAAAVGLPDADTKVRVGFSGNTWWLGFVFDDELWLVGGVPEGDGGVVSMDGDELTITNGVDGWITFRWSVEGDALTMTHLDCVPQSGEGECEPSPDFLPAVQVYTFSGSDASY